eukprot:TRINITY_DN79490_c0_g1_i1.p1 TRINITY_DN79490_c0_g1~~TRINITY_DN79490_c0_g1_i1.p1  ORF type:complete len:475 (-),score=104.32 TRINITY_DN79490_c0_g1_i1:42-1466(-)
MSLEAEQRQSLLDSLDAFSLAGAPCADAEAPVTPAAKRRRTAQASKRSQRKSAENGVAADAEVAAIATPQAESKPSSKKCRSQRKSSEHGVAEDAEVAVTATPQAESKPSQKRYRQAKETAENVIEVLCFTCRRSKDTAVQQSVTSFFKRKSLPPAANPEPDSADSVIVLDEAPQEPATAVDIAVCGKCRRPLQVQGAKLKKSADWLEGTGELPHLQRLRAYRRTAGRQGIPFTISEKAATALMRSNCVACGTPAPSRGHGLTRLRRWPEGMARPEKGGLMGPYAEENLEAACTMCNLMKGYHTVGGLVERCRHIATKHTPGEHFGECPMHFRDNVSRRSRSSYITSSSTHTKTHAITNEEFSAIVAQRCFYCHKEPRKPKTFGPEDRGHFNGLDRLDSNTRVYTSLTAVACCGTCNLMKYKYGLEDFLEQCRKIARFNVGVTFSPDQGFPEGPEEELEQEECEGEETEPEDLT